MSESNSPGFLDQVKTWQWRLFSWFTWNAATQRTFSRSIIPILLRAQSQGFRVFAADAHDAGEYGALRLLQLALHFRALGYAGLVEQRVARVARGHASRAELDIAELRHALVLRPDAQVVVGLVEHGPLPVRDVEDAARADSFVLGAAEQRHLVVDDEARAVHLRMLALASA